MWVIFYFLIGASMGSFASVCIERIPEGRSVVYPPSSCPFCGKRIKWYDNIPLVSYIILMGKCRYCKTKIPFWYFLTEMGMGGCYAVVYMLLKSYVLWLMIAVDVIITAIWIGVNITIKKESLPKHGGSK